MNQAKTPAKKRVKKKAHLGRTLLYIFFFLFVLGLIGAAAGVVVVRNIIADTPPIENYDINTMLAENSVVYDHEGIVLQKLSDSGVRTIVQYDAIDEDIKNAFIAVEDKTFNTHNGFNYIRLIGAVLEGITSGSSPAGTSTITQQYARNMYLPQTRFAKGQAGYIRKIKEAYYTVDLEKHLSKNEILTAYLNTIDLGANVSGIQAATQRYFSKNANDVNYIEAAILAGIPKANTRFSPFTIKKNEDVTADDYVLGEDNAELTIVFNERCLDRFKVVVTVMYNNGIITKEERDQALATDIKTLLKPGRFISEDISSYFIDMLKDDVVDALVNEKGLTEEEAVKQLYSGGLHIYSTLDLNLQKKLDASYNSEEFSNAFDQQTRNAVVAFQKKYNLGRDGVAGPKTIEKLGALGLMDLEKITTKIFQMGVVNDDVILLKQALEKDGLLYKRNENMPSIVVYRDAKGHILSATKDDNDSVVGTRLMLNKYDVIVDENESLVLPKTDYKFDAQGNLVLSKNRSLLFNTAYDKDGNSQGIDIFIKDAYKSDPSFERRLSGASNFYSERVSIEEMYIFKGKTIKVPYADKGLDENKNLVIYKSFIEENPDFYTISEDGSLRIAKAFYDISKTGIIQPQSAMVVMDQKTGHLKAIVGGRNITGQRIYNRATNPRQPGSAIKPISVYLPAVDSGITAATPFDDVPRYDGNGNRWPQNWYDHEEFKYRGIMTVREAIEVSNNVIAVKIAELIGVDKCFQYLKKLGITTLRESGSVTDNNLSAVALGGMSDGLTPLELTNAFGTIANGGVRNKTLTFTKITDKNGNIILENKGEKTFVVDEKVAYVVHDMMYTGAVRGLAKTATLRPGNTGIPIAGKTGTTSSKHDAWFVGYSPYYVAGMWIGNDMQVPLDEGSASAARYWRDIMKTLHEGLPDKSFKKPEEVGLIGMNVDSKSGKIPTPLTARDPQNTIIKEWFIPGTQPTEKDDIHVEVTICKDSGKLATPYCPASSLTTSVKRLRLDADYSPTANLKPGQAPYAIKDSIYTIPRSYLDTTGVDFVKEATNPKSPYCHLHTSVIYTANSTASMLVGVRMIDQADGQKIVADSIVIKTVHEKLYNVDAGSRINKSGTLIATDGTAIYPWQIASFAMNPNGPVYEPIIESSTEPSYPDGFGEPTTTSSEEPPLTTEKNP